MRKGKRWWAPEIFAKGPGIPLLEILRTADGMEFRNYTIPIPSDSQKLHEISRSLLLRSKTEI